MNPLPGAEGWQLAVMLANGKQAQAERSLEAHNRIQRAFGHPEFTMPAPAGSTNGLVTCLAYEPLVPVTFTKTGGMWL